MRVITGTARGMTLKAPKGMQTRPTLDQVKEAIFSAIQFETEGRRVLDLFAGSGQMGIEALSRGAASAVFTDNQPQAISVIRENLQKTHFEDRSRVIRTDFVTFLSNCTEQFDIIILDPPYEENFLKIAIKLISEIDILSKNGIIICESSDDAILCDDFKTLKVTKTYHYGKVKITIYRKVSYENCNLSGQF